MATRLKSLMDTPKPLLAYTASSIGFGIISHVFGFYYVKVFLKLYHIQSEWFQFAQILYLVWNTINDPLFAYFQDHGYFDILKTRRYSVLISAPLWVLSFLIAWIPWETKDPATWVTGVHLIVTLCLYDTMFTFLGLTLCALFTEISPDSEKRVQLLRWSKVSNFFASGFVFLCEYFSDSLKIFWKFQFVCVIVAVTGFVLLRYAGANAVTEYEAKGLTRSAENSTESFWRLTYQILTNRNFVAFVIMNYCHEFHATFLYNFMAILCENLIPTVEVSQAMRSFMYFVQGIVPSIIIIFGAPLIQSIGYYRIIRANFISKFVLAFVLYTVGRHNGWLLLMTMVVDGGVNAATFGMYNIVLADIADEDKRIYKRVLPNSSMIFGTNALVMKSVYSIAPMTVVAILNRYGYDRLKNDKSQLSPVELNNLYDMMFYLICFIPIIVAVVQYVSWSFYRLRTTHISHTMVGTGV